MIKIAIAMVLGSVTVFYSSTLPDRYWVAFLPMLLLLACYNRKYQFVLLLLAACLWASLNIQLALDKELDSSYNNTIFILEGVIADIPEQRSQSIRFLFEPRSIADYPHALPKLIRLSWYRSDRVLNAGERWRLQVKLKSPAGYQNPGGFDYERWLFVKRIGASGYVKTSDVNRLISTSSAWNIDWWRSRIGQGIRKHCADCSSVGLMKALSIGFRADIAKHHRALLQDTGTAHLLAISGLHIGMISAMFFFLGRIFWPPGFHRSGINRLQFSSTLGFAAGFMYAALAGFSLPTVRALIMLAVVFLALSFRSGINLLNSIAIAVIVILIVDPLAVGSASFWLSITALLIIAFAQYLMTHQSSRLKQVIILQLIFSVLFIPLNIVLFNQLNPASFFANIVAIPLVSLIIVPFVLLASLLSSLNGAISGWLFVASDKLLSMLLDYLEILLDSGLAAYPAGEIPSALLVISAIGLLVLLMPAGFPGKKAAALLLVLPLVWQKPEIEQGAYQLSVLDVGMGTSAVIQTKNHSLIYDFGPGNASGFSAAEWVLKPYLQQQGIRQVDLMIISHVDADHSGGFISYLDDYDSSQLISGTPAEVEKKFELKQPLRSCHQYTPWRWDGVHFEFITSPGTSELTSSNNRSCVLKVSGFHASLLAGDIEAEQELLLVRTMPDKLKASVLLAPHHGSKTSSTTEFLETVNPEISVFTVGRNNRWRFPKTKVLEAYRTIGSQIYRTDLHGAITVRSGSSKLTLESYRRTNLKFWH